MKNVFYGGFFSEWLGKGTVSPHLPPNHLLLLVPEL